MRVPAPDHVLRAFGRRGPAVPLSGGQGASWRAGDLVLKPVPPQEQDTWCWLHHRLAPALSPPDSGSPPLRVALPLAASDGSLLVDGWGATRWIPGSGVGLSLRRRAEAARAFHRAAASAPADLPRREDPWARADRQAWGEEPPPVDATHDVIELLARLPAASEPAQLVHGDISGNVIDHPSEGLGVLDLSLYRRPVAWSEAVLAVDVMAWEGAPASTADDLGTSAEMLIRALLFRLCAELNLGTLRPSAALMRLIPSARRALDQVC